MKLAMEGRKAKVMFEDEKIGEKVKVKKTKLL